MIDIYCERTGPEFWSEPVNALTNAAFLVAAWLAWRCFRTHGKGERDSQLLIAILAGIGIGSFLFHVYADKMTLVLDVVPILIFQLCYLTFYSLRILHFNRLRTTWGLAVFLGAIVLCGQLPQGFLNGSGGYLPALMALLLLGIWHYRTQQTGRMLLLLSAALFVGSLTFRSLDMAVCDSFPLGLHFMWHMLNAGVLYLALRAYLLNRSKHS